VDVLPTLLDAAGVDVPANVQGRSFWPLLTGGAYRPRQEVFVELTWHGGQYDPMRGIRTERWKYIRNFIPGRPILIGGPPAQRYGIDFIEKHYSAWRPEDELYDLGRDPDEKNDLARSPEASKTLADLRARLMQFLDDTADPLLGGDVPQPVYSDYECYWTMRQGAKYRLVIGQDFREYPFPA
jgi:arylsulfatase A-like enzyme